MGGLLLQAARAATNASFADQATLRRELSERARERTATVPRSRSKPMRSRRTKQAHGEKNWEIRIRKTTLAISTDVSDMSA